MNQNPKISIVTVVYNDEAHILETIKSVTSQSYRQVEYIVIDGKSTDKTLDVIKRCQNDITTIVSEKDDGIYHAMNKGVDLATGDWILFLNAGDLLYDNEILQTVSSFLKQFGTSAVVYGHVSVRIPAFGVSSVVKSRSIKHILRSMPMSHQACFINARYHKVRKYNTAYRISADYEFLLGLYKQNVSIKQIDLTISNVLAGGISDLQRKRTYRENLDIQLKNSTKSSSYFNYLYLMGKLNLTLMIKRIVPKKMLQNFYRRKYKG